MSQADTAGLSVQGDVVDRGGNLATRKPATIMQLLEQKKDAMAAVATQHLTPDKLIRIFGAAQSRVPKLAQCTPTSVLLAAMTCSELGLVPSSLGTAYLVPYGTECTLIIGYRGFIELARRSGQIVSIQSAVVREGDEFEYEYGLEDKFRHKIKSAPGAAITHVWCLARFKDGGHHLEVMTVEEVNYIRARSKAKDSGPWVTDFGEMCKKTCVRRASKYWPLTIEVEQQIALADRTEFNFEQTFGELEDAKPTSTDRLNAAAGVKPSDTSQEAPTPKAGTPKANSKA